MRELSELVKALTAVPLDIVLFENAGRDLAALDASARDGSGPDTRFSLPGALRGLAGASQDTQDAQDTLVLSQALEALAHGYLAERDLAQAEQARAQHFLSQTLLHQATHDPLTGLPNRTALMARLNADQAGGNHVGICYLDLDGFKAVNDKFGHDTGDKLLAEIAARVGRTAGAHNALAARVGGDEFVILTGEPRNLPDLTSELLAQVSLPVATAHGEIQITACAGIVDGIAAPNLIADADAALYHAKATGPGRWEPYEPTGPAEPTRTMAASILSGLERGEFEMTYVPVVSLADGELRAARAVPRWRHPALGELSAEVFLPLAEGTPAASALTRWLVDSVRRDTRGWGDIPAIVALPDASPAAPLQLEVSETTLSALTGTGTRLVIRDFGSGSAGLVRLRDLPVAAAILREDLTAQPDEKVVTALTGLAHSFGVRVAAGDIRTAEQAQLLRDAGCELGFGPLFSGPVPAKRIGVLASRTETAAALARLPAQTRRGSVRKTLRSRASFARRAPRPPIPRPRQG
jgi:diguanylate cyclase (GGDEF)-like protein